MSDDDTDEEYDEYGFADADGDDATAGESPDDPADADEAHDRGDYHGDADEDHGDHEHGDADRPDYDPQHPDLPSGAPPLRSTAPQSDFTFGQVTRGFAVLAVGLLLTFGLALALA